MRNPKVGGIVDQAAVYIPFNCEAVRIIAADHDEEAFYGVGEESDQEYKFLFDEVDLDNDVFYKLVLMENK